MPSVVTEGPPSTQGGMARLGFADSAAATRNWSAIGSRDQALLHVVAAAADPDQALRLLARLSSADSAGRSANLIGALEGNPEFARRLTLVLGASAALGDHLVAHPEEWHQLDDSDLCHGAADRCQHHRRANSSEGSRRAEAHLPSSAPQAGSA
ncbi:MAG: hypothetical protein WKF73_05440 [Nocardioidaceae bacterium]